MIKKQIKNDIIDYPENLNTYLGNKGYTILKSELSIKLQLTLKEMLMVKPYIPGSPVQVQKTFPAYRESDKKMYVPRYFGEELFGPAKNIKITEGDDINLEFKGTLRDYQQPVIEKYLQHVSKGGGGLLELFCGWGKCLKIDTPIIMYDGTIKKVQDIIVGDILMGDDSTPRNVLSLARGRQQMYKITNIQGDTYTVNESHILSLKCSTNYSREYKKGDIIDISVKDYLNLPKSLLRVLLGYKVGVNFKETIVEFDPYLFGYWLCDGASEGPIISTREASVIKYIVELCKHIYNDMYLSYISQYDYKICSLKKENRFITFLKKYNLINNKYIPYEYKSKKNCYEITQKNSILAEYIVYLCRSFGFACYSKKCYNLKNGKKEGEYNRISLYGSGLEEIPVLCQRKKCSKRTFLKYRRDDDRARFS